MRRVDIQLDIYAGSSEGGSKVLHPLVKQIAEVCIRYDGRRWRRHNSAPSTAPRRAPARIALQARAIPHHREIPALGAGLADVPLHPRFRPLVGDGFGRRRKRGPADRQRRALGHVAPEDIGNTVLGGGVGQDKAPPPGPAAASVISNGLVRGRPGDKLMLVRGATGGEAPVVRASSGAGTGGYVQGATALKGDLADSAPLTLGGASFAPAPESVADKRAEARMKGYVGEACPECGNFTMVRNGTCLKCDTCGSTTGCS